MGTNFTEYFSEYAKCYDDFDAERLIDYFYVPTFNVKNGTVSAITSTEELSAFLKSMLAGYKEHSYKKGNVIDVQVMEMGKWSVLATVHWVIEKTDGTILRDFNSTYNLFKDGEAWKIIATTNHDF